MRTTLIALAGLFSFTVVCPVSMGGMLMGMGEMPSMFHVVQSDDGNERPLPCEQCKKEKVEVVSLFSAQDAGTTSIAISGALSPFWEQRQHLNGAAQSVAALANGPPLPVEFLIQSVILRV